MSPTSSCANIAGAAGIERESAWSISYTLPPRPGGLQSYIASLPNEMHVCSEFAAKFSLRLKAWPALLNPPPPARRAT
jgi:hypothetical protein